MLQRYAEFIAWIAFAWALVSAFMRYYWHWGGRFGIGMLPRQTQDVLTEPDVEQGGVEDLGYQGMLLAVLALLFLVSLRPWGEVVPQGPLFSLLLAGGSCCMVSPDGSPVGWWSPAFVIPPTPWVRGRCGGNSSSGTHGGYLVAR